MVTISKTSFKKVAKFLLAKRSPVTFKCARNLRHIMAVLFHTLLFGIGILGSLCLLKRPMSNSSFYLLRQRRFLLTGSSISLTLPTLSANAPYKRRLRFSVGRNPVKVGSGGFFDDGQVFSLESLLVWIPSVPKHSTAQLLKGTLISFLKSFRSMASQWRIYITWMKRVASEEVGERALVERILCHTHDAPGINNIAQTLSSSQSLNVSVQMGLLFFQDFCFQARNSLQNGLKSLSSLKQLPGTHQESLFYSFTV